MVVKKLPGDTILSRTVRKLLNLPAGCPSSAYHLWVTLSSDITFMRGILAKPYTALASGSPWFV